MSNARALKGACASARIRKARLVLNRRYADESLLPSDRYHRRSDHSHRPHDAQRINRACQSWDNFMQKEVLSTARFQIRETFLTTVSPTESQLCTSHLKHTYDIGAMVSYIFTYRDSRTTRML